MVIAEAGRATTAVEDAAAVACIVLAAPLFVAAALLGRIGLDGCMLAERERVSEIKRDGEREKESEAE